MIGINAYTLYYLLNAQCDIKSRASVCVCVGPASMGAARPVYVCTSHSPVGQRSVSLNGDE